MEEQDNKIMIMKISVLVLMVVVLAAWGMNIRKVFLFKSNTDSGSKIWNDLKSNLYGSLDDIAKQSEKAGNAISDQAIKEKSDILASEMIQATANTKEEKNNQEVIATTTEATSSTVIETEINQGCPDYINCMPTIGQAPDCQIPPGCEDTTQLVY